MSRFKFIDKIDIFLIKFDKKNIFGMDLDNYLE